MRVLAMVVAALKGRGPRVFVIWVALCLAFAFVFRVWGERPLGEVRSSELTGMAFATAVAAGTKKAGKSLGGRASHAP